MTTILSKGEVESLLAALDHGAAGESPFAPPSRFDEAASQISVYDFKRPERVSKEHMQVFKGLHEGFSREFGANLSAMLRNIVEVKLISVDQLTYSEFVFSLDSPTCFNLLNSEGLGGHLILDLNPAVIFPIVDRLLGGGRHGAPTLPGRPLTEIELRLIKRVTDLAIGGLETAWSNICELNLKVVQIESNPQLVQIVPPNEVVVLVSFEISLGDSRGLMNLCIPFNTIEPLMGRLSADTWAAYTRKELDPRQRTNLEVGLKQAKVEVTVELARSQILASEVYSLSVGDVIVTETPVGEPAEVLIERRPAFRAAPGLLKGKKAVRVTEQSVRPKDLIAQKLLESGENVPTD